MNRRTFIANGYGLTSGLLLSGTLNGAMPPDTYPLPGHANR